MEDVYRKIALMQHLGCEFDEIEEGYQDDVFEVNGGEYMVLDDDEADEAWEDALDNYLAEVVMPELPEIAQKYFNEEAWKEDAKYDGRGHSLSPYDGEEYETVVDHEAVYIYQVN